MTGFRSQSGTIVFNPALGWSDLVLTIPCGQCIGCKLERTRQWAVRIMHENKTQEYGEYITLTYDNEHLPEPPSLNVKHFQKFIKDARYHFKGAQLRYFHCGEYGEKRGRPHYHCILWGANFTDRVFHKKTKNGDSLYTSETLNKLWPYGTENVMGDVTFDSAAYCARYILGKITGKPAHEHYGTEVINGLTGEVGFTLKPEYTTMSRKPGIGKQWIDKWMTDVYPSDEVIINGVATRPPKFYDQQYQERNPLGHRILKIKREKEGDKHFENNTYRRLKVREELARLRQNKRELNQ